MWLLWTKCVCVLFSKLKCHQLQAHFLLAFKLVIPGHHRYVPWHLHFSTPQNHRPQKMEEQYRHGTSTHFEWEHSVAGQTGVNWDIHRFMKDMRNRSNIGHEVSIRELKHALFQFYTTIMWVQWGKDNQHAYSCTTHYYTGDSDIWIRSDKRKPKKITSRTSLC